MTAERERTAMERAMRSALTDAYAARKSAEASDDPTTPRGIEALSDGLYHLITAVDALQAIVTNDTRVEEER